MATRASSKRKRGSAPVSPPSDGRAARRARGSGGGASAAAAEAEEPPTLVSVEGSWVLAMQPAREAGQLIDVTLVAGGRRIEAHRLVLLSLSPYLNGLLTSGLAESAAQSRELTLEDMDGRAVEAVVDCMYSGKLALSPSSVTAVIRVANMLQVGEAEKAAGEFFVSKLEPGTTADALGFAAERAECGEHAKELHEKCVEYAVEHFAAVSREASFLGLPANTVARLIGSDDLPVAEPDVVSALRSWFGHDTAGRKGSLKTLMPLVRWPLLPAEARRALCGEPLFEHLQLLDSESRSLSLKFMLECGSSNVLHRIAEDSPRFKRRTGGGIEIDCPFPGAPFGEGGVLHHIGTDGGTKAWSNPHTDGKVVAAMSSVGNVVHLLDPQRKFVGHTNNCECCTDDLPGSWMSVDLGDGRAVAPTHYCLRTDSGGAAPVRNWTLQGKAAEPGAEWVQIRRHDNDATLAPQAHSMGAWPVEGEARAFRHLRIHQHGPNGNNHNRLRCCGFEVYGTLIEK